MHIWLFPSVCNASPQLSSEIWNEDYENKKKTVNDLMELSGVMKKDLNKKIYAVAGVAQ